MSPQNNPAQQNRGSILERVLSSQYAQAIEHFIPSEVFLTLVKPLTEKEQEVLRRRFGLQGREPETLEEIGNRYKVTRERIRQIQETAIQKTRQRKDFHTIVAPVERLLLDILSSHGGVMEARAFFHEVLSHTGNTPEQERALSFLLEELLHNRFERRVKDEDLRTFWKLKAQSLELPRRVIKELTELITRIGYPLQKDELLSHVQKLPLFQEHKTLLTDEAILSYLGLSKHLGHNPFGEYGLTSWGSIVPKRMNDKIYLVLKKHGKPLHFVEIAERINQVGFDERRAYPPTVHNELILNKQYVLVGRGIYALGEWGYKPGVVSDVLVDILKHASQPMTREELLSAVLEQRLVKKNTVLLALTNKTLFHRLPNGAYELNAAHNTENHGNHH